jgi:hypothetical protein
MSPGDEKSPRCQMFGRKMAYAVALKGLIWIKLFSLNACALRWKMN